MPTPLVTIFARDLAENLYPDNQFYKNSIDDSAFIEATKVNLAQAGDPPTGVKNPSSYPLTTERREDSAQEYNLDLFATKPTHIRIDEDLVVNYDKRQSILSNHSSVLNTMIADNFCDLWFPSPLANMVRTSGSSASSALAPGATGTRKAVVLADFINMMVKFDKWDLPSEDRFALFPTDMYADLLNIPEFINYEKRGLVNMIEKGLIGEVLGFKVYKRSRVGIYTNASTPVYKAYTATSAVTDNLAALFWQKSAVRRAEGSPEVLIADKRPEYLGSLMNTAVRAGGIISRADSKGVAALVQITT